MATLTIGVDGGSGFFNLRGTNTAPYAMGSSVVIQNTGGDINTTGGYEGVIFSQLTFQASGNAGTSSLYGNVWNSAGTSITNSSAVSAAADAVAPMGSKTFNLSDQYFATPQTVYVGFSRAAAQGAGWDVVNGNNTTRISNNAGSAPSGLTGTGTGTVYRRLVGTATYSLYDAGSLSRSVSQISNRTMRVTFAGSSGTHGKNVDIAWGDSTTTSYTVAAGATPATQDHTYASAGSYTITTTISYSSVAVGIPDITFTNSVTVYTVPGAPTSLTATPGNASVALSWTAPSYLGSGTVNYALYRGATLVYNSTATSFTDTGLANGTSYSYTVYASNTWGTGGVSNTASETPFTVPSTPSVTATPGVRSINIGFGSSSDGGSVIYFYQYSLDNTNWSGAIGSPYNITGLSNGTSYTVYVRAVNAAGVSGSGFDSATTFSVPTAPQSLSVTPGTAGTSVTQASASWSAPSSNGGSAIIRYEYSIDGSNWTDNSTSLSATITSLSKYSSYTFYVRAVNAVGNSTAATASFTTFGGRYAVYDGTGFVDKYAQKYDGSAWSNAPIREYNGTTWDYTDR
ncbi:Fibronectin type III [uncultured Caudovirales phage]|uniref:Fibronectin type III n=1 Tax=uncultured Caudovirales phage TaxID=2100421 RepID=A0A6J5N785_9CAUD|nr:Fibronectin type III [uncultured Caudovirales phage]